MTIIGYIAAISLACAAVAAIITHVYDEIHYDHRHRR